MDVDVDVDVDVEVEIRSERSEIDYPAWDNIAEASIRIPSGKLVVMGCTDYLPDARRIEIDPVDYQLLSLAGGLDSIKIEWEPANDLYKLYCGQVRCVNHNLSKAGKGKTHNHRFQPTSALA